MRRLTGWLSDPRPEEFPYDEVVGTFQRTGKHFVADGPLKSLARARDLLRGQPPGAGTPPRVGRERERLLRFLDIALDKYDGVYDYLTYTALAMLDLPGPDHDPDDAGRVARRRDRMVALLLADAVAFERAAADGRTGLLPEMRPAPDLVAKRYRLAVRVARPALARLGVGTALDGEPAAAARALEQVADREADPAERGALRRSMLPVYVSHDEYLFIRVLQTFETTFAAMAVRMRAAIAAADRADPAAAADGLDAAAALLVESAPLFSLLATMQVVSFRTFREFTEGASAIQSRNYKLLESLCRNPDAERLESAAYSSTPPVQARVRAGQRSVDDAYRDALGDPRYGPDDRALLSAAMGRFAAALGRWRRTHYRLALRMLGERSGTGYTQGTPYLSEVRGIPVFRHIDEAAGDEER